MPSAQLVFSTLKQQAPNQGMLLAVQAESSQTEEGDQDTQATIDKPNLDTLSLRPSQMILNCDKLPIRTNHHTTAALLTERQAL